MRLRILVFLALISLAGCSGGGGTDASASATPGAVAAGEQSLEGPGKAYLEFQATLKNAKSLSEVLPYLADEQAKEVRQMDQPDSLLPALKALTPANLKVTGQDVQGKRAILQLTGDLEGSPSSGSATMIMEDGKWKLLSEAWSDAPEASPSPSATGDS